MAIGISGSNGGITPNQKKILVNDLQYEIFTRKYPYPMEVSFFINNICNLRCQHCYVAYEENHNALSTEKWKKVFDELILMGALTFGNVGKEPTLDWDKTKELLFYFKKKRQSVPKLRFGFVTNGTLLDNQKIEDIEKIQPNYIDISLDGTKNIHDYIRGIGNYDRTIDSLKTMSKYKIINKVFVSFTANKLNLPTIVKLIDILYRLGVKNILLSPYVTLDKTEELYLLDEEFVRWIDGLLSGNVIDFCKYQGLNIYIKSDYITTPNLMGEFLQKRIIDKHNLFVDDYGVIFNRYTFNGNDIYFNYLPWDDFLVRAIRISHDGYVSNCFDMFFPEYPERAIGNVQTQPIKDIIKCSVVPNSQPINHFKQKTPIAY